MYVQALDAFFLCCFYQIIAFYSCSGCPTYTTSRRRCCPQSVSTTGCQVARGQSGSSGIGCDSFSASNQARRTKESSQEIGIYWSSFEWYGHASVGLEKCSVSSRSCLLHPSLYTSLSVHLFHSETESLSFHTVFVISSFLSFSSLDIYFIFSCFEFIAVVMRRQRKLYII